MTTLQKPAPKKKRRRIRRSKNSKNYFTQIHEDAINEYNLPETTFKRRDELYVKLLQPVFSQLVDKIVFTYRFTILPNIEVLRDECKIWLITVLNKFDPSKGSKAFSYFSVITKNWFIQQVKKNKKKNQREIELSELSRELELKHVSTTNDYDETREKDEFWKHLWTEIETWDTDKLKENEKKVLEAVKILLSSPDDIEIEEVIKNIRDDRDITRRLLDDVMVYLSKSEERHKEVGLTAAKYVETLQRSNEQLVKISALLQKDESKKIGLTEDDKKGIFDLLQEEGGLKNA